MMQKVDFNDKMDKWCFSEGDEVMVATDIFTPDELRYISVVKSNGHLSSEMIQLCAIHCDIDYELTSYIDGGWVVVVDQSEVHPILETVEAVLQGRLKL